MNNGIIGMEVKCWFALLPELVLIGQVSRKFGKPEAIVKQYKHEQSNLLPRLAMYGYGVMVPTHENENLVIISD